MPPSRQIWTGSSGQDIVRAGKFGRKTMKKQHGTMKNHENRPESMKNQPGTIKKL